LSISTRVFITPIYQRILGKALEHVVNSFNLGNPLQTWEALKTVYHTSAIKVKEECKEKFAEINHEVQTLNAPRSLRNAGTQIETENRLNKFLFQKNSEFYDLLVATLIKHRYLEDGRHDIPLGQEISY